MNTPIIKRLKKEEPLSTGDESVVSSGNGSNEDEEDEMRKNKAMEEVFRIPFVLQEIIEDVEDLSDLKQCRLVSSMWKETATKVMLKRDSAFVALKLDCRMLKYKKFINWNTNRYCDSRFPSYYIKDADDLSTLKEIVDKSTQFPCSTFVLYEGDLSGPDIEHFFKVVGKSIKNLKLIRADSEDSLDFGVLSGLEELYMNDCYIGWSPKDIPFELPKLKMLDMKKVSLDGGGESPFEILGTLIAPNLKVIQGFDLSRDLETVVNGGKTHCIKKLHFLEVGKPDDLTKFEMLVQAGPQLETLKLGLCSVFNKLNSGEKSKWMRLVQKLLDLSRTTLTSFRFKGTENAFRNLHFLLQFPQLREIEIPSWRAVGQGESVSYPYEILTDDICPNLKVIKGFDLDRDTQEIIRAGKIHCVKDLFFSLSKPKLEHLRLFLSAHPQLDIFRLYWIRYLKTNDLDMTRELTDLLEQLLELSKDTLKRFEFCGVGDVFENMKFPKFSKLQHILFAGKDVLEPVRMFPRGINLTETFPTLEILDLHECSTCDESWDSYFPPPDAFTGSLTSVKTLIIRQQRLTLAGKRNVRMICPNGKMVFVCSRDDD